MSTTLAATRTSRRTRTGVLVLESVVDRFGIAPVVLRDGEVRIGAGPDCDVVVPGDDTAESRECIVSTIAGETRVLAGDARLWLNNVPIDEARLRAGDRLAFGAVEFRVRRADADELAAVPEPATVAAPVIEPIVETVEPTPPVDPRQSLQEHLVDVDEAIRREQDRLADAIDAGDDSPDPPPVAEPPSDNASCNDEVVAEERGDTGAIERRVHLMGELLDELQNTVDENLVLPDPHESREREDRLDRVEARLLDRERQLVGDLEQLDEQREDLARTERELEARERSIEARLRDVEDRAAEHDQSGRRNEAERSELDQQSAALVDRRREADRRDEALNARQRELDESATRLDERSRRTDEREVELRNRTRELDDRAGRLDEREQRLERRERTVEEEREELVREREAVGSESEALAERRREADRREEALDARQRDLDESAARLDDRNGRLGDRDAELVERGSELDERARTLEEREERLDRRERSLDDDRDELTRRRESLDAEEEEVRERRRERDAEFDARRSELDERSRKLTEAERELDAERAGLAERSREVDESAARLRSERTRFEDERGRHDSVLADDERRCELDRRERDLDERRAALDVGRDEFETERRELQLEEQRLADERVSLDARRAEIETEERQLDARREELTAAEVEHDRRAEAAAETNEVDTDESGGAVDEVLAQLAEAEQAWTEERTRLSAEAGDLRARLEERDDELESERAQWDGERRALAEELAAAEERVRSVEASEESTGEPVAAFAPAELGAAVPEPTDGGREPEISERGDATMLLDVETGTNVPEPDGAEAFLDPFAPTEVNELAAEKSPSPRLDDLVDPFGRTVLNETNGNTPDGSDPFGPTVLTGESESLDLFGPTSVDDEATRAEADPFGPTVSIDEASEDEAVDPFGPTIVGEDTSAHVADPFGATEPVDDVDATDGPALPDFEPVTEAETTTGAEPDGIGPVDDDVAFDFTDDEAPPTREPFGNADWADESTLEPVAATEAAVESVEEPTSDVEASEDGMFGGVDLSLPDSRPLEEVFGNEPVPDSGADEGTGMPDYLDGLHVDALFGDESAAEPNGEESALEPSPVPDDSAEEPADEEGVRNLRSTLAEMFDLPSGDSPAEPVGEETSIETPAPLRDEPTSLGESGATTFDSSPADFESVDDNTFASFDAPEPEPVVGAAPAAEEPAAEEEDSVQAYMERLLARNRGGEENASTPAPVAAPKPAPAPEPVTPEPIAENPVETESPGEPPEPKHRQDHAAVRANIDSLREVANLSARTAIASYTWKQLKGTILAKGTLLLVCVVLAGVLLSSPWWSQNTYGTAGLVALAASIVMGWELRRSIKLLYSHGEADALAEDRATVDADAEPNGDPADRLDREFDDSAEDPFEDD